MRPIHTREPVSTLSATGTTRKALTRFTMLGIPVLRSSFLWMERELFVSCVKCGPGALCPQFLSVVWWRKKNWKIDKKNRKSIVFLPVITSRVEKRPSTENSRREDGKSENVKSTPMRKTMWHNLDEEKSARKSSAKKRRKNFSLLPLCDVFFFSGCSVCNGKRRCE